MESQIRVIESGLRQISFSGKISKGFNSTVKSILKGTAMVVFLAEDCENPEYSKLIASLCTKHGVPLVEVPSKDMLGDALGLTNYRSDGSIKKKITCAACAVNKIGSVLTPEIEEFARMFGLL